MKQTDKELRRSLGCYVIFEGDEDSYWVDLYRQTCECQDWVLQVQCHGRKHQCRHMKEALQYRKENPMNDEDRYLWILNDEGLYKLWRGTRPKLSAKKFIRSHRAEIDEVITNITEGKAPAHYLAYPHDETCMCIRCQQKRKGIE